jgi:hypothetical protein
MTFLSNPLCQRGAVSLRPEQVGNAKALENAKRDEIASRALRNRGASSAYPQAMRRRSYARQHHETGDQHQGQRRRPRAAWYDQLNHSSTPKSPQSQAGQMSGTPSETE